jgi:hypothetical protein
MKKFAKFLEIFILGVALYVVKAATTILTLIVTSAIVALFVTAAFEFSSSQSDGAVPALGYLASLGVSFILIFTSYVGARGAAQSKV